MMREKKGVKETTGKSKENGEYYGSTCTRQLVIERGKE